MTNEEAEQAFQDAQEVPLSKAEIQQTVDYVVTQDMIQSLTEENTQLRDACESALNLVKTLFWNTDSEDHLMEPWARRVENELREALQ